MKRASYRLGVELIALNDEPTEMDEEQVKGFATVQLLADLFGVESEKVAKDIIKFRKKHMKELFSKVY